MRVLTPGEEVEYLKTAARASIDLVTSQQSWFCKTRPDEILIAGTSTNRSPKLAPYNLGQQHGRQVTACASEIEDADQTFRIFERRSPRQECGFSHPLRQRVHAQLSKKAHRWATRGKKGKDGEYEGGAASNGGSMTCDIRSGHDSRVGGLLPVLAKYSSLRTPIPMAFFQLHTSQRTGRFRERSRPALYYQYFIVQ